MSKKTLMEILGGPDPFVRDLSNKEFRALTSGDNANLLTTEPHNLNFVDGFKTKSILTALGANYLSGLDMSTEFPKIVQTDVTEVDTTVPGIDYQKPEVGELDEISLGFAYSNSAPKRLGAFAKFSKQLHIQENRIEGILSGQISDKIVYRVEQNFFTDLAANVDVNDIGAALTHANLNLMEAGISIENEMLESPGYAVNPADMGKLKTLEMTGGTPLYQNKRLNDWPVYMSSAVPANTLLFGKFNSAYILQYDQIQVLKDIFTQGGYNLLIVSSFFDWFVTSGSNFSKLDIT